MNKLFLVSFLCSSGAFLRADFTYQETTLMTGGSMMAMLNAMGPLARGAREPIVATHIVKGNRMATITKDTVTVIDLDKESITTIDNAKKTYSMMTFAEMKQRMEEAAQRMQSRQNSGKKGDDVKADFKVSAKATGKNKTVQGLSAKEMIVTMAVEGTDTKTGDAGAMNISMDGWYTPVPGYDDVKAFHRKMVEKLGASFGSGMQQFAQMGQANMGEGFEEVAKEMSKIDGVPVENLITMGGAATPAQPATPSPSETCSAAPQTSQQPQSSGSSSVADALSRFGGFGRKKNNDAAPAQQPSSSSSQGCAVAPASGTLMEMTISLTSFSSAPADTSKFEVPANYKQIQPRGR